ncbi:hypothetical protein EYM_03420 [Ignicoccus islandicus DSM 13165]|uniref:Exosome complex component Csl4 n=1 Tax=Ignicoccus islandicus DSM 13165 TaxID=940295 RepID=A0A0U3F6G2_9CREN|nr:exosome complex RNA-binding protein Csl4 [Ignicoccus islandicus]ALU11656.1 hypothetical protein EYM_03420 [Ignicoccus islandicus DSM 13165]
MPFVKNNEWVVPGQPLAATEELMPGKGTFVDNGIIRASIPGVVKIDMLNYQIEVRGKDVAQELPSPKSSVIGYILSMRDELALVKVTKSPSHALKNVIVTGALHISQASSKKYLSSLYDGYAPGDIVKLKVISGPPYVLTAKGPRLGVLYSTCSVCGNPLWLEESSGKLKCLVCGHEEERVVSTDYLLKLK